MEYSAKLKSEIRSHYRKRISIEKRDDREIQKSCDQFHDWCDQQKKAKKKPLTIIAEGDSWFRYVIGKAVVFQLEKMLKIQIQNLASPGDEVSEMLSPKKLKRLAMLLKRGPTKGWKYDCMLFSGGGNDLVGKDRFHKWLHPYKRGMQSKDILNQTTIKAAFSLLEASYDELIEIRNKYSPKTHLYFHAYDWAIPDGRKACWLGPWMKPSLEMRKISKNKRREVVKLFLQQFDNLLDKIAKKNILVTIVQTQGTLIDKEWSNELHPTNSGFKNIAKVFRAEIEKSFSS